jgi:hypothetical protein
MIRKLLYWKKIAIVMMCGIINNLFVSVDLCTIYANDLLTLNDSMFIFAFDILMLTVNPLLKNSLVY